MKLALAVVLMILAAGPVAAGDNTGAILGGIGSFADSLARSMAEARKEAMEQERLRLERQRLDQELAYQRAVLEQNQRQFDAQMAAQREQRALFDAARRRAAEEADHDAQSGNAYNWNRRPDGATNVHGLNSQTGSQWNSTIQPNGNQRGTDSLGNTWNYNAGSGTYTNSNGKVCVGQGAARVCN